VPTIPDQKVSRFTPEFITRAFHELFTRMPSAERKGVIVGLQTVDSCLALKEDPQPVLPLEPPEVGS
jgi:hypothetical protein